MLMGEGEEQKGSGQETLAPRMPVLRRSSRRSSTGAAVRHKLTAGDQRRLLCSSLHSNTESIAAFFFCLKGVS